MKTATAPKSKRARSAGAPGPIRILTAVPICDGHDSAINTINLEFIRHGIEVIYLGYHRSARDIVRAAIQEDVRAIGISSYNGGHVEFFIEVVELLKGQGAADIAVFGGGGGTISHGDARLMQKRGVERIFPPGTSLELITQYVKDHYGKPAKIKLKTSGNVDRAISKYLSGSANGRVPFSKKSAKPVVIGITGPGGRGRRRSLMSLS